MRVHPHRERAQAAQDEPRVERREDRAEEVPDVRDLLEELVPRLKTSAPPCTSLWPPKYFVTE